MSLRSSLFKKGELRGATDAAQSLLWGSVGRGEESGCGWPSFRPERAFLQEWAVQAAAEPSELGRDKAQGYSHSCLAIDIPDRNKATEPGAFLGLPELPSLCVGLQSTSSANLRTGTKETLPARGAHSATKTRVMEVCWLPLLGRQSNKGT